MNDASGYILPGSYADFAQMSANLVQYYNTGGFDDSGIHFQSPTPYPVTWWGIFNEPNGNGLTPQQYTSLYNAVAPAMAQAYPSIQFVAVELSDFGTAARRSMPSRRLAPLEPMHTASMTLAPSQDFTSKARFVTASCEAPLALLQYSEPGGGR